MAGKASCAMIAIRRARPCCNAALVATMPIVVLAPARTGERIGRSPGERDAGSRRAGARRTAGLLQRPALEQPEPGITTRPRIDRDQAPTCSPVRINGPTRCRARLSSVRPWRHSRPRHCRGQRRGAVRLLRRASRDCGRAHDKAASHPSLGAAFRRSKRMADGTIGTRAVPTGIRCRVRRARSDRSGASSRRPSRRSARGVQPCHEQEDRARRSRACRGAPRTSTPPPRFRTASTICAGQAVFVGGIADADASTSMMRLRLPGISMGPAAVTERIRQSLSPAA